METSVREELHKIINEANDVRLGEIYDWLHEGLPEAIQYTPDEIQMFYGRLEDHRLGKTECYTVEESFALIRNNMA